MCILNLVYVSDGCEEMSLAYVTAAAAAAVMGKSDGIVPSTTTQQPPTVITYISTWP